MTRAKICHLVLYSFLSVAYLSSQGNNMVYCLLGERGRIVTYGDMGNYGNNKAKTRSIYLVLMLPPTRLDYSRYGST